MSSLVRLYEIKRLFCFLDEWLYYGTMLAMWKLDYEWWIVSGSFLFGAGALITSYRNLHDLEIQLGLKSPRFFEPLHWMLDYVDYLDYFSRRAPKKEDAQSPKAKPDAGRDRVSL